MGHLSRKTLLVFVAATLAGACLHFLYLLLPNPVTALFAPVNESIWEHLKLIYWPFVASTLILCGKSAPDMRGPWLASLLIISAALLGIGYTYHVAGGGESAAFDVGLYVLLMGAGFLLVPVLNRPAVRAKYDLITLLALALGAAILLFTFLPPDHVLFTDLARTNTWSSIPF